MHVVHLSDVRPARPRPPGGGVAVAMRAPRGLSEAALAAAGRIETDAREAAALAALDARLAADDERRAIEACTRAYEQDAAAFIAHRLLWPGHPCPVCGGAEHPAPVTVGADTDGPEHELAQARARREAAEAREREALRRLEQAEKRLAAAQVRHDTAAAS